MFFFPFGSWRMYELTDIVVTVIVDGMQLGWIFSKRLMESAGAVLCCDTRRR